MSTHAYQVLNDLRQSQRFPKEPDSAFAVIWRTVGDEFLVEICDESLGGLGVLADDRLHFAVGDEATIVYAGCCWHAVACHIEPRDDGRSLVGFACDRLPNSEPPTVH